MTTRRDEIRRTWVVHGTKGGGISGKITVQADSEAEAKREARRRWGRGVRITKAYRPYA